METNPVENPTYASYDDQCPGGPLPMREERAISVDAKFIQSSGSVPQWELAPCDCEGPELTGQGLEGRMKVMEQVISQT